MANEIFDRETMLDLLVNVIPLFIIAFFTVGFVVFSPFGIDPLASSIQFGLLAIPFVLLTILTYFAGVAVAGSERRGAVYLPGQASVSDAEPLEVEGDTPEDAASAAPADAEPAAELDGDAETPGSDAADPDADADEAADADAEAGSDPDADADEDERTDA